MLARSVAGGALPGSIIVLLDQLLLVLLIVELLSRPPIEKIKRNGP
jgi:hypothetical protein